MTNGEYSDNNVQAGNGASRGAGHVRGYGMGVAGRQGAVSQPVPDPYQQSAYPTNPQNANAQGGNTQGYNVQGYGVKGGPVQPYSQPYYGQPTQGYAPRYGMGHAAMAQPASGPQGAYVPPATSVPQQMQKKRRGRAFWVCIGIAILCVALGCVLALTMCNGQSKRSGSAGQLEGKTEAEIQAELDRQVDEGMFNISIASTAQFETGTSEGDLRIENVPNNPYLMQVVISRDDTGEEIYRTDMIEPNHHIQRDTLDVDLDPGNYECTAMFFACDKQTEDVVGQAAAKMLIVVNG